MTIPETVSLEPATIRLLRETLEERLERHEAAAILFDALAEWGPGAPTARGQLSEVVQGPLRRALLRRLPEEEANRMLRRIERVLITAESPTGSHGKVPPADAELLTPEDRATDELPILDGAASVMVMSATDELAINLAVCLEGHAIIVRNVGSLREMTSAAITPPDIVILDCKLPTAIDYRILASALRGLSGGVLCIVWGADLGAGERFVAALEGGTLRVVPVTTSAGVAPILDLVLSRVPPVARR